MIKFYKTLWHELKVSYYKISNRTGNHRDNVEEVFGMLVIAVAGLLPVVLLMALGAWLF